MTNIVKLHYPSGHVLADSMTQLQRFELTFLTVTFYL